MEHEDQHHSHHAQLVEEIAQSVEDKLVAKFAKWVIANGVALLLALIGGIAAYYDVKHDAKLAVDKNGVQDERMVQIEENDRELRRAVLGELERVNTKVDEINRFLRDHNQVTIQGLSNRNGK